MLMLFGIIAFLTVNVPYWDDYGAIIGYFAHPMPERLNHLADFNNEHRIVTARLIFEAIYQVLGHFDFQICMAIGATFLLGYAMLFAHIFRRSSARGTILFLPCLWLLVSFIHYENLCWAMCAVSNIPVHFWALLASLALSRQTTVGHSFAIVCALLATFSAGGGMAIWPCLILFTIFQNRAVIRRAVWPLAALVVCASLAVSFYFTGFSSGASESCKRLDPVTRIFHMGLFFVSFVGGWIPSFWPALVIGILTLAAICYFTVNLTRIRTPAVYFFLLYLLGNISAAALFRSTDFTAAISFRYILVPVSVLTCVVLLAEETFLPKLEKRLFTSLWLVFFCGAMLYSCTFLAIGGPLFAKRNEIMRRNMLCWPQDVRGLRCPPEFYTENDRNLKTVSEAGIYNPHVIRHPNETPPSKPISWLR